MADKFYITTSIAYVNAPGHIGFALELLQADVLARYHRQKGDEVFFLTGTDEHGAKIARAAESLNKDKQKYVDEISGKFEKLTKALDVSNNDFIRTTDKKRHWPAVVKIWQKLRENGDLYRAPYKGYYCVGHEAFMKPSELKDGQCPIHPQKPEIIEEENWFFRLTKYKKILKEKIENDELKILPLQRKNEILNLLDDAEDVSFSRPRKDLRWGIPVPDDDTSTIYVWADALTNYLSAIGYADETDQFKKLWPADIHLIGKDILRFHALIWPAMLISAGLTLPKAIYVHGFITVEGEKMSKSLGNVADPFELVKKYGLDAVRYFLLREIPSYEDGDFSYKKLEERYNGDLADNLGNLVSRTAKLLETRLNGELILNLKFRDRAVAQKIQEIKEIYDKSIAEFKLHEALGKVWELLSFANSYIDNHKPWVQDDPADLLRTLTNVTGIIFNATKLIEPFLPQTAERISKQFGFQTNITPADGYILKVAKIESLFPKLR